jgi:hypothetical protein
MKKGNKLTREALRRASLRISECCGNGFCGPVDRDKILHAFHDGKRTVRSCNFEDGTDAPNSELVISLSMTFHPRADFWFPTSEMPWITPESLFGCIQVLHKHPDQNVLIHCDAGINRSVLAVNLWHWWITDTREGVEQWIGHGINSHIFRAMETMRESTKHGWFWINDALYIYYGWKE